MARASNSNGSEEILRQIEKILRQIEKKFKKIDKMANSAFDRAALKQQLNDAEARATAIAGKTRMWSNAVAVMLSHLSQYPGTLKKVHAILADGDNSKEKYDLFRDILDYLKSGKDTEEAHRMLAEWLEIPTYAYTPQLAEVEICLARISNLQAAGTTLGLTFVTAYLNHCNIIKATQKRLPQPPGDTLLKLHDSLELLLKVFGPIISPVGAAIATAVVEVCKWGRKRLLEKGASPKEVAKTLVVVELLLDYWEKSTFPEIVQAVKIWSQASLQATGDATALLKSIDNLANESTGVSPPAGPVLSPDNDPN